MERVSAVFSGEEPDRVPVTAILGTLVARFGGYKSSEYSKDPEKMAKAQIAFFKKFGMDVINAWSDVGQLAEGWGCPIKFVDKIESTPMIMDTVIKRAEGWETIEIVDPEKAGRMPVTLDAIELISKELGDYVPIMGFIFSPMTIATWLRGMDDCMRDVFRDKELLKVGLDRIADTMIEYSKRCIARGGHALIYLTTRATADILLEKQYEEIAMPSDLKILRAIKKELNVPVAIHACGTEPLLKLIADNYPIHGINFWDRGAIYDLGWAKREFGGRIAVLGGLDQNRTLIFGTLEEVEAEVKDAIRTAGPGGRFMLTPGCELSAAAPDENIMTVMKTVKECGKYPLEF
jgi:MtaA/CmuA family methyltransferase